MALPKACLSPFLLFLWTLQGVKGTIYFRSNEGYDFLSPQQETFVYSQFNQCPSCRHYYTANFKKGERIFLQVFVPAHAVDTVNVIKMIGPLNTENYDTYTLDKLNLVPRKTLYEIDEVSQTNSSVILEILSNSPHAHYGVVMGHEKKINFLEYSLWFAATVQRLRWWSDTFLFFVFYVFLSVMYFLTWPLHRFKSYVVLPKLAIIAYLSWVLDAFYMFFYTTKYTEGFNFFSFFFHVFPNLTFVIILSFVYEQTINKEIWLLSISIISLLFGGGGFYIGSACLLASYAGLMTMKNTNEGKDKRKLFCQLNKSMLV